MFKFRTGKDEDKDLEKDIINDTTVDPTLGQDEPSEDLDVLEEIEDGEDKVEIFKRDLLEKIVKQWPTLTQSEIKQIINNI